MPRVHMHGTTMQHPIIIIIKIILYACAIQQLKLAGNVPIVTDACVQIMIISMHGRLATACMTLFIHGLAFHQGASSWLQRGLLGHVSLHVGLGQLCARLSLPLDVTQIL